MSGHDGGTITIPVPFFPLANPRASRFTDTAHALRAAATMLRAGTELTLDLGTDVADVLNSIANAMSDAALGQALARQVGKSAHPIDHAVAAALGAAPIDPALWEAAVQPVAPPVGSMALVECSDGEWREAFHVEGVYGHQWVFANNARRSLAGSNSRPRVSIDPEDEPALAALLPRLRERIETVLRVSVDDHAWRLILGRIADDLSASITDPKPDEPTGLGAVVEDDKGRPWIRWSRGDGCVWRCAEAAAFDAREWSKIAAVRVLSEGVAQ